MAIFDLIETDSGAAPLVPLAGALEGAVAIFDDTRQSAPPLWLNEAAQRALAKLSVATLSDRALVAEHLCRSIHKTPPKASDAGQTRPSRPVMRLFHCDAATGPVAVLQVKPPGGTAADRSGMGELGDVSLYRRVLDATDDFIFEINVQRGTIYWPDKAFEALGRTRTPLTLDILSSWIHPEDRADVSTRYLHAARQGTPFNHQFRLLHEDGSYRTWRSRGRGLYDPSGQPMRMVGTNTDLTDVLATRAELARRTEEAEALQRSLDRHRKKNALQRSFVAMLSHEFRTPLTVVQGTANQVRRRGLALSAEKLAKKMTTIEGAADRMVDLIEVTLNAAQLDAGAVHIQPERVDLAAFLETWVEAHAKSHPDHSFEFRQSGPPDLPGLPNLVTCDPTLMRQVLGGIVSNAVKFSPPGSPVVIELERFAEGGARFSVTDRGPGIPAAEQPLIFDRFFRGQAALQAPGAGMGLYVVKELVALHRGEIEIERTGPGGTRVSVTLPAEMPETLPLADRILFT